MNKFCVNISFHTDETNQNRHHNGIYLMRFRVRWHQMLPMIWLLFCSQTLTVTTDFDTCADLRKEGPPQLLAVLSAHGMHSLVTSFDLMWTSQAQVLLQHFAFAILPSKVVRISFMNHINNFFNCSTTVLQYRFMQFCDAFIRSRGERSLWTTVVIRQRMAILKMWK